MPGITASRDYLSIMLQSGGDDRRRQRVAFRRMATDMASRYLRQMPIFSTRNLAGLQNLLGDQISPPPKSKLELLQEAVEAAQRRVGVNATRLQEVTTTVDSYTPQGMARLPDDVRLEMIAILIHRMEKRGQASLFEDEAPEPASRIPKVDVSVYDAARIHLLHRYGRPYYVGIDDLCDASSENAEQFLRLAADLVELAAVNVIRGQAALLDRP